MKKTFWVSSFNIGLTFVIVSALHQHLSAQNGELLPDSGDD